MKPSQLASQLRRIATAIDNSKKPDRTLVAWDLKRIIATVAKPDRDTRQRVISEYAAAQLESKGIIADQQVFDTTKVIYELLNGTNFDFLENEIMKPSQLASQLRRIASKIDASKSPDRTLVARDLKKVLAAVSSGTGALRAIIENEEIVGIEADFNGKKYVLDYPCDDDGDDRELDDATAFKMVETTYKGQDDQEVDDIISLGAHPKAMNADYEDNDGDYIYKVWFFLSDVDNVDEVNVLKTMIS